MRRGDRKENAEKLTAALRRNRGEKMCPEAVRALAASLGRARDDLRTVDLQQTTDLWEVCSRQRASAVRNAIPALHEAWPDAEHFEGRLAMLADRLPDVEVALLLPWSGVCGAVRVSNGEYLANVLDVFDAAGGEAVAAGGGGRFGIWTSHEWQWFERTSEGPDRLLATPEDLQTTADAYETEAYELLVWGGWADGLTVDGGQRP